jgi:hypothetical protein
LAQFLNDTYRRTNESTAIASFIRGTGMKMMDER